MRFESHFEASMLRCFDWGDILACLQGYGSEALATNVAGLLEHHFHLQKDSLRRTYLLSFCAMCTDIYRYAAPLHWSPSTAVTADTVLGCLG